MDCHARGTKLGLRITLVTLIPDPLYFNKYKLAAGNYQF